MRRLLLLALVMLTGMLGRTAFSAPIKTPSERACIIAWNADTNHANQLRLHAARPLTTATLLPTRWFTFAFGHGSTQKRSSADVCLLTLNKEGRSQQVTGHWRSGHVTNWSWSTVHIRTATRAAAAPFAGNVRVLADGRVTKIYRR